MIFGAQTQIAESAARAHTTQVILLNLLLVTALLTIYIVPNKYLRRLIGE